MGQTFCKCINEKFFLSTLYLLFLWSLFNDCTVCCLLMILNKYAVFILFRFRKSFKCKKKERVFPKVSAAASVSSKVVKSEAVSSMYVISVHCNNKKPSYGSMICRSMKSSGGS